MSTSATDPAGAPGSRQPAVFLELSEIVTQLNAELKELTARRDRGREKMVALLREVHWLRDTHRWHPTHIPMKCKRFDDWSATPYDVDHKMVSSRETEDEFIGEFVFWFRGELVTYEASTPLRYLQGDPEKLMLRESESELSRLYDEAGELPVNERGEAVVKRLMSMYPQHAADILKRSHDIPFRLKVSALMARTLLEALDRGVRHDKENGKELGELHGILSAADQAALGSIVVRTCYGMTKQPVRVQPLIGPYLFRNFVAFNGIGC